MSRGMSPSTDRRHVSTSTRTRTADGGESLVLDGHRLRVRHTLTGEDVPLGHFILIQRVVDAHGRLAFDEFGHAGAAVAGLAAERRRQSGPPGAVQQGFALDPLHRRLLPVEQDGYRPLDSHSASPCAIEILLLREYYSHTRIVCSRGVVQGGRDGCGRVGELT